MFHSRNLRCKGIFKNTDYIPRLREDPLSVLIFQIGQFFHFQFLNIYALACCNAILQIFYVFVVKSRNKQPRAAAGSYSKCVIYVEQAVRGDLSRVEKPI